jgi:hypothetical protein
MTLALAIAVNLAAMIGLSGLLFFIMSHPRKLAAHG